MSAICELAAPFVANAAIEGSVAIRPFRAHSTTCLKCQARYAAMRRTARALAVMAGECQPAPPGLEWKVMSSLEGDLAVERTLTRPLALLAAVLSMAAAVVVWRLLPRTAS